MSHVSVDLGVLNRLNNLKELFRQRVVVIAVSVSVFESGNSSRG